MAIEPRACSRHSSGKKGAKMLGTRLGNWLMLKEAQLLWQLSKPKSLKGERDRDTEDRL
jgi:hypothetical protein